VAVPSTHGASRGLLLVLAAQAFPQHALTVAALATVGLVVGALNRQRLPRDALMWVQQPGKGASCRRRTVTMNGRTDQQRRACAKADAPSTVRVPCSGAAAAVPHCNRRVVRHSMPGTGAHKQDRNSARTAAVDQVSKGGLCGAAAGPDGVCCFHTCWSRPFRAVPPFSRGPGLKGSRRWLARAAS
jgi:hypothetical protein